MGNAEQDHQPGLGARSAYLLSRVPGSHSAAEDGEVEAGPNAVLAFRREGYRRRDISPRDLSQLATYKGFWRMAWKYWRTGLGEMWRSFSKRAFHRALQRLIRIRDGRRPSIA